MNASRFLYRSRQFWHAISNRTSQQEVELIKSVLTDPQIELFQRMQPSEQAHSIVVLNELLQQEEQNPDLLVAALLHDVGKSRAPLRVWERVMIVVVRALCQECIHKWGKMEQEEAEKIQGWRRAFIVAEQHPAWGADLAAACGTSPLATALIARHQEQLSSGTNTEEEILLSKLQAVDDMN
jgi:hypothetical protein